MIWIVKLVRTVTVVRTGQVVPVTVIIIIMVSVHEYPLPPKPAADFKMIL